ncbi:hypothetical protein JW851_04830 [Candidatus Woesearchaeota archaeon]|nr:hypothetical protein [Candidatus Woesearchaeota archaeon]
MKKLIILASALAILLLVGCVPQEPSVVCNLPYTQVGNKCCMDLNSNGICDSDEQPFKPGEVSGTVLMKQYINTLNSMEGYSYKYKEDTYKVHGTTVKKELARQTKVPSEVPVGPKKTVMPWVDVIYFDTVSKIAAGYCEGLDETGERMCSGFGLWDIEIPVDYDKHYKKTPTEWLMEFSGKEPSEIKPDYRYEVSGLEVTGLIFVEPEKTTILDIDPRTGIVWRATVDENGYVEEYQYADVKTGTGVVAHEFKTAPERPIMSETGDQAVPKPIAE